MEPMFDLAPPSPPRPPPPPDSLKDADPHDSHTPSQYRALDRIEQQHEDLRDSRDHLMGSRYRLQSNRQEVRKVREETGAKEGSAINQLRVFLHENGIELPWNIEKALNDVHDVRDRLGSLEAEYGEAEDKYNMQELQYTQKEMRFIDNLLNDENPPIPLPRSRTPPAGMGGLTSFAFGPPDQTNTSGPPIQPQPVDLSLGPPEQFFQTQLLSNHSSPTVHRATSIRSHHSVAPSERLHSEESPSNNVPGWSETKERIDVWLLDMISSSPLQQAQLKAMDLTDTEDKTDWWQQLVQNWKMDTSASNRFHNGGSTFTRGIISQEFSTADLDIADLGIADLEAIQPPALLPEERVVDALEEPNIPPSIESGDLRDVGQKVDVESMHQEQKDVETSQSVSTGPANTHRTFSSDDLASVTTIEQTCSCLNCGNPRVPPGHHECDRRFVTYIDRQLARHQGRSAPTTPRPKAKDQSLPGESKTLIGAVEQRKSMQTPPRPDPPSTEMRSKLEEGSENHAPNSVSTPDSTLNLDPDQIPLPPSPTVISPKPPWASSVHQGGARYDPNAALRSLIQFPFPILQLAPVAMISGPDSSHKLDINWLPFVSVPGSSLHLPGPTSDDLYN